MVNAATPAITIDSVGGQAVRDGAIKDPLSGTVEVRGSATLGAPAGGPPAASPLVADAGDSPFVPAGSKATLIGAGWGGQEPYAYAWTTSAGAIAEGETSATALLDTAGVAPGTITATLRVTDAAGQTATDTVKVVISRASTPTLLDETKADPVIANVGIGNPTLTTYLGHSKVRDTYWYLSACPELMGEAASRLEARWGTVS